jgi:hypothetical protein
MELCPSPSYQFLVEKVHYSAMDCATWRELSRLPSRTHRRRCRRGPTNVGLYSHRITSPSDSSRLPPTAVFHPSYLTPRPPLHWRPPPPPTAGSALAAAHKPPLPFNPALPNLLLAPTVDPSLLAPAAPPPLDPPPRNSPPLDSSPTMSRHRFLAPAAVTPGLKDKSECIEYMCARIKLHTCIDSVYTKTQC